MTIQPKTTYSNCYFGVLYLWLRGKIDKVALVTTMSPWVPYHFVVLNKKGHALHFDKIDDPHSLVPLHFHGRFVGVRKSKQFEVLAAEGRKVHRVVDRNLFIFLAIILFYLVFPFWLIGWALTPIIKIINDVSRIDWNLLDKRRRHAKMRAMRQTRA